MSSSACAMADATASELADLAALLRLLRCGSAPLHDLLRAAKVAQQAEEKAAKADMSGKRDSKGMGMGKCAPVLLQQPKPASGHNGGWETVQDKKKIAKEGTKKETLLAEEFSVTVVENTAALKHNEPAVCLGNVTETDRALQELKPAVPQAVLCPVKRNDAATEVWVVVKDEQGKEQARRRYMHQLSSRLVVHTSSAQKGGKITDTSKLVVLSVSQKHSGDQTWKQMRERPRSLIADWLKSEVGANEILEIRTPSITDGTMQTVVRVDQSLHRKVLTLSGRGGIFSRPWYEKQETSPGTETVREFRSVPIPLERDLASSLRMAEAQGEEVQGVVPYGPGFALRVRTASYEKVLEMVQEKEALLKFKGSKYEVKGLPLSWGSAQIKEFLGDWDATPLFGTRRGFSKTWVVAAVEAPLFRKMQHDFGLAVISEYEKKAEARPRQMWVGKKRNGSSSGPKSGGSRSPSGAWSRPAQPPPAAQKPREQVADEKDEEMQDVAKGAIPHQPALQAAVFQAVGGANLPGDFLSQLQAMVAEAAAKAVQAAIAPITEEMRAMKTAMMAYEPPEDDVTDEERTEDDMIQQAKRKGKGNALRPPDPPAAPVRVPEPAVNGKSGAVARSAPY